MSTAGPDQSSIWKRDIFALFGIQRKPAANAPMPSAQGPLGKWEALIFANGGARREAKGILFSEMSEAVRQGMPLVEALGHASQSFEESRHRKRAWRAGSAERRHGWLQCGVALLMALIGQFGYMVYTMLAFRMVDAERIARILANRLLMWVAAGYSLSEAMRRSGFDYDAAEIRLVENSENWGTLPEGLKRLGEFQISEQRLTMQGSMALYPIWLAGFLMLVASFYLIFILPKFKDIFDQLGAELPSPTAQMYQVSATLASGVWLLVGILILLPIVAMFLLRALMNGSNMTKFLLMFATFGLAATFLAPDLQAQRPFGYLDLAWYSVFWFVRLIMAPFGDMHIFGRSPGPWELTISLIVAAVVIMLTMPYLLSWAESLVLWFERRTRPLLKLIPVLRSATRAEEEARWLSGLSLGLSTHVPVPKAVRAAGEICGGSISRRSAKAAELVGAGYTVGQACIKAGVLKRSSNYRMALLDGRPDYLRGLKAIADDAGQAAFEWLNRSGRILEVFMIIGLALVSLFFAVSMYMPLFQIPQVVGHNDDAKGYKDTPAAVTGEKL